MDPVRPKIRFEISPGSSARISEQEHKDAGPARSMRIQGGIAARTAESAERAEGSRAYGVSMQARTGKPCTLADLMEAEAQAQRRHDEHDRQPVQQGQGLAKDPAQASVRSTSFRPVEVQHQLSATSGDTLPFPDAPAGTNKEAQTPSRSPFQTIRSLFSRIPGMDKHDRKRSQPT
jgi:hypothetical protein